MGNPSDQTAIMKRPDGAESPIWPVLLLGAIVALTVAGMFMNQNAQASENWLKILGVIATLGIFSILYRENPFFRFLEHIYIGLATGYGIVILWVQFLYPRWFVPMLPRTLTHTTSPEQVTGQWWWIFGLLVGLLFFTVYVPKLAWMNRFAIGVVMGWAAGNAFQAFMGLVGPQVVAAFGAAPITTYLPAGAKPDLNNIHLVGSVWLHPWSLLSLVVLLSVMTYFFFAIEHRNRAIRTPANAGRYFLMITLGVIFGTTVMSRFTLLLGRLDFLLRAFTGWMHGIFT